MGERIVLTTPSEIRAVCDGARAAGRRVGFVPTMGALHAGHLALVSEARRRSSFVVCSIFVNPTQFGPNEDLARYPRDEAGDLAKARTCGVDLAFCPEAAAMYPPGAQTFIEVRELQRPMCGASRPGHFAGVATVVAKLFHATLPHVAVFGEKDYQQLAVVRQMVRDLDLPLKIVGAETVREADGLAMSSRNAYLSAEERRIAPLLHRAIADVARAAAGRADVAAAVEGGKAALAAAGFKVDYLEVRDAETLRPAAPDAGRPLRVLVAAWLGKTRLIDNVAV